jgi:hypothetical protein
MTTTIYFPKTWSWTEIAAWVLSRYPSGDINIYFDGQYYEGFITR